LTGNNTNHNITIDDFVNDDFFIGDNSLIDVAMMSNSNTNTEDKGDLVNSNNYNLYIYNINLF